MFDVPTTDKTPVTFQETTNDQRFFLRKNEITQATVGNASISGFPITTFFVGRQMLCLSGQVLILSASLSDLHVFS